jgi:hypothetical protein
LNSIPEELACQQLVELVTEYLENTLSLDNRAKFEAHIRDCGNCQEYLRQIRETMEVTAAIPGQPPAAETKARLLDMYREMVKSEAG